VLDEPTSLLDPAGRREIRGFLETKRREDRAGFVFVTQYPDEALACDRLVVLGEGKVACDGPPADVFREAGRNGSLRIGIPASVELERLWEELQAARRA